MLEHIERNRLLKLLHIMRNLRSWADQAHIAFQHVKKLRQLVDAGLGIRLPKRVLRGSSLVVQPVFSSAFTRMDRNLYI